MASTIRLTQADGIATIQLANPPGNRITFAMRREVLVAIEEVSRSDSRVLVIRGDDPDFCRGGDVREWIGQPVATLRPKIEVFANALRALRGLDIPTLAVVRGACMGGGFELAIACDFIVASENATFRFPEALSGILTLQGGALTLAERIGPSRALAAVLLAENLTAAVLAERGIVTKVTSDQELETTAGAFAERLASVVPAVVAATKQLYRLADRDGTATAMAHWYDVSMPLFDQPETQAALAATARAIAAT